MKFAQLPIPRTSSGLPKTPLKALAFVRQYLTEGNQMEHAIVTRDSKLSLGTWLDKFLTKNALEDIEQHKVKNTDKTPFVARCGNIMMLVEEIDCPADFPGLVILRGTIIEGTYFNDRGEYKRGDKVSIGPITHHWRRITPSHLNLTR